MNIENLRKAGEIARETLDLARKSAKGLNELELAELLTDFILSKGGTTPVLGYHGFPAGVCISTNRVIAHGVPTNRFLENSDVVKVDVVVDYKGMKADTATTIPLIRHNTALHQFSLTTKQSLQNALNVVRDGVLWNDVAAEIERTLTKGNLSVCKKLCGHGIGTEIHMNPRLPNFFIEGNTEVLKEGMIIAIEPLATTGLGDIGKSSDGHSLLCLESWAIGYHEEHTIIVTKSGYERIT